MEEVLLDRLNNLGVSAKLLPTADPLLKSTAFVFIFCGVLDTTISSSTASSSDPDCLVSSSGDELAFDGVALLSRIRYNFIMRFGVLVADVRPSASVSFAEAASERGLRGGMLIGEATVFTEGGKDVDCAGWMF